MINIKINTKGRPAPRPRVTKYGTYNDATYTGYKAMLSSRFKGFAKIYAPAQIEIEVNFFFIPAKGWKRTKYRAPNADADNLLKGILDSANGILWDDDRQIHKATVTKAYSNVNAIFIKIHKML